MPRLRRVPCAAGAAGATSRAASCVTAAHTSSTRASASAVATAATTAAAAAVATHRVREHLQLGHRLRGLLSVVREQRRCQLSALQVPRLRRVPLPERATGLISPVSAAIPAGSATITTVSALATRSAANPTAWCTSGVREQLRCGHFVRGMLFVVSE